ncbi:Beta-ketoacyl-acyl-carrier-protein synthase I [Serratia rubidaea]|uniref:acyl carrier protein n=1 Tax=Serratia rubidaea TaxID=61652 RepID=UPI0006C7391D|nr:acyl carrier protein [Serratia rubidaea]MDK1702490.1 acyl carrier protein [Serratia rubidaea]QPR63406.1 acyl carrier protein [Serratia rubidaea]CAI0731966.1 Beta-ketoacyl-acyl-carrier-protein synthase I [Serratia rubidaea]CAI1538591.1 Beta-ketoacyl-acyl-carrier-protein synthase I [Serratia rubidaea]HAY0635408.1 acyl carrier protein [Serratia rubidaea]
MNATANDLKHWLIERVATYCRLAPAAIKEDANFADYGMDSVFTLTLIGEIEDHLGLELDPTTLWDNPSVEQLHAFLARELKKTAA